MKSRHRRKGQSLIEFIFVFILFLNLLLLTFNAVLAFAVQQYISYAVFMAARAFQAASVTPADQATAAKMAFGKLVNDFGHSLANPKVLSFTTFNRPALATEIELVVPVDPASIRYGTGMPNDDHYIRATFKVPLVMMPLGQMSQSFFEIDLQAVSYLGREPTRQECFDFFKVFWDLYKVPGGNAWVDQQWKDMDDNNC
jgi:hypothetical protein